jgi:RimJ/RimL family protein N-acetyltransferase
MLLVTDRLVLREFDRHDWKLVHAYASDPEVVHFSEWGPNTEEESKGFVRSAISFQKSHPRSDFEFAVVIKDENILIGSCGIHLLSSESSEGEAKVYINRRFWKHGFATEATNALLSFGFDQLSLHRIFATSDPRNSASNRVLEKIGMHREGRLRRHKWAKGSWNDAFIYSILDYDWVRLKAFAI